MNIKSKKNNNHNSKSEYLAKLKENEDNSKAPVSYTHLDVYKRQISGRQNLHELHGPAKEGEQKRSVLSYNKAELILGWKMCIRDSYSSDRNTHIESCRKNPERHSLWHTCNVHHHYRR